MGAWDWIKENAGMLGSVAGGIGGFALGGPAGAALGAGIGGGLGGMAGGSRTDAANRAYGGIDRNNFNVPGYDERQKRYIDMANQAWNRQAPQAGTFQAGESSFRQNQQNAINDLWQRSQGEKSLAAEQLRQEGARNIGQQQAFAASARPGQGAMMARTAAQNAGRINQGMAGQTAQARLAEMMGASQLGGQLAGQARGQDLTRGMFNAGQQQQGAQFNVGANLQQQGMNQQQMLELLRQEQMQALAQQSGGMGYENQRSGRWGAVAGQPTRNEQWMNATSGLMAMYPALTANRGGGGSANPQLAGMFQQGEYAYPGIGKVA